MSKDTLGLLLGFIGMVIFALTVPVTRIAVQSFDPVFVTVGRVVLAIVPLGTAVAATLTAGERPSTGFWLCAVLGTAVVLGFVLTRSHGDITAADLLFLAAAACAAFGYTAGGVLARSMPGWEVICWQLVLALPVTAALTLRRLPEIDWHAPA